MKNKGFKSKQPDFEEIQKALSGEWQERLKNGKPDDSAQDNDTAQDEKGPAN